jgi:hypothetical protein
MPRISRENERIANRREDAPRAGRPSRVTERTKDHAYLIWGPTIGALALCIRFGRPEERSALIAACVASEPFHIVAHVILYGTLAWLTARRFGDRAAAVLGVVLGMGVAQELAQVVGARAFGRAELFDLMVDGLAALAVLGVRAASRRGRALAG